MALQGDSNLLKLATQVVNDKNNPFKRRDDVTLKDFDKINGDLMIDVVSSILSCIYPAFNEQALNKQARLHNFEELGFSPVEHDATAEMVFRAARKFFPVDNTTLDLCIFIMPQYDVKRAKQVIVYLMGYFVASDQIHEMFEPEWERLNTENREKIRLYEEIEVLRNTITEHVVRLQSSKDAKPALDDNLKDLENQLRMETDGLTAMEEDCSSERTIYEDHAIVIKRLETELYGLNDEKTTLEGQIVASSSELQNTFKLEQQAFNDEQIKRDSMGAEIKDMGQKAQLVSKTIERVKEIVQNFEEQISILQAAAVQGSILTQCRQDHETTTREIEELQSIIKQLDTEQDNIESEYDKRMGFFEEECSKLEKLVNQQSWKVDQLQFKTDEMDLRLEDVDSDNRRIKMDIGNYTMDLQKIEAAIEEDSVQYEEQLISREWSAFEYFSNFVNSRVADVLRVSGSTPQHRRKKQRMNR